MPLKNPLAENIEVRSLVRHLCIGKPCSSADDQYGPGGGMQYYITAKDPKVYKKFNYDIDRFMIDFTEGRINLGEKNILTVSSGEGLNRLAAEGIIEKRKTGRGRIYYYIEATSSALRFGVFIRLREKRIEWLRLHWLDSSMKGWDDVSEKGMKDEYRLLSDFVEKLVGRPPDNKRNSQCTWRFNWGEVEVAYEPRAYQADIFMKPR